MYSLFADGIEFLLYKAQGNETLMFLLRIVSDYKLKLILKMYPFYKMDGWKS